MPSRPFNGLRPYGVRVMAMAASVAGHYLLVPGLGWRTAIAVVVDVITLSARAIAVVAVRYVTLLHPHGVSTSLEPRRRSRRVRTAFRVGASRKAHSGTSAASAGSVWRQRERLFALIRPIEWVQL
ncbi:unnamed protein product, partial [Iphiclides podalirius]